MSAQSLPKPSALAECHNLIFGPSLSYSNATDNFKVEKSAEKVHRIYENGVQNLQVKKAEFYIFWHRILTTLLKANKTEMSTHKCSY